MRVLKKDITTIEKGVLLNGVNCQRAMGSGVALAYFEKWPQVRDEYMRLPKSSMHLGRMDPIYIKKDLWVANCFTQEYYGRDGKVYADWLAILSSVSKAALFSKQHKLPIYSPWIGCGLGGMQRWRVEDIFNTIELYLNEQITVCEL